MENEQSIKQLERTREQNNKVGSKSSRAVQITWSEEKTEGKECETPKTDSTHLPKLLLQYGSESPSWFGTMTEKLRYLKKKKKREAPMVLIQRRVHLFFKALIIYIKLEES
jgi:hypothetical protein